MNTKVVYVTNNTFVKDLIIDYCGFKTINAQGADSLFSKKVGFLGALKECYAEVSDSVGCVLFAEYIDEDKLSEDEKDLLKDLEDNLILEHEKQNVDLVYMWNK